MQNYTPVHTAWQLISEALLFVHFLLLLRIGTLPIEPYAGLPSKPESSALHEHQTLEYRMGYQLERALQNQQSLKLSSNRSISESHWDLAGIS
jgi:hypothetical protein